MSIVIAACGAESEKIVNGQLRQVIPFVGADSEGEFGQLGIGLIFPNEQKKMFWGLVAPHALIQSWRGMKILERLEHVNDGTLCKCWTVAESDVSENDMHYLEKLANDFGDVNKFHAFRDEVLVSVPSDDELNAMIMKLRDKEVEVDSWELEEEVAANRIATSPLIQTLAREAEECSLVFKRKEEEINKPLPREQSLSTFFEDLGIGNSIVGGGFGGYGMDWGHIDLKQLDKSAKGDSFSKYLPEGHRLEHTTKGPETTSVWISADFSMHTTSFGEIEKPWFNATDGTKYTFMFAKFRDDRFYIKTKVEKKEESPIEGDYTISELRDMIGQLPPKPVAKPSFFGKFASFFQ